MFPSGRLPFENRPVVATRDPGEARELIGRQLKTHALRFTSGERAVDSRMNQITLGDVSIFYLRYGADVLIDPGPFDTFYIVHINIGGACDIAFEDRAVSVGGNRAAICLPDRPARFRWRDDSEVLGIKISKAALENHYQELTGLPLQRQIDFDIELDLGTPAGQRLVALLRYINADALSPAGLCTTPAGISQLSRLVMTTLLIGQSGSHHALVNPPVSPAAPHYVRRAEAYMHAHLQRALTLDEIAAHAGVSGRSLTNGFRDFRGASPMAYFSNLRLERARQDLMQRASGATVTSVANHWGFHHLSSFASLYRRRFGASPAETLRRG